MAAIKSLWPSVITGDFLTCLGGRSDEGKSGEIRDIRGSHEMLDLILRSDIDGAISVEPIVQRVWHVVHSKRSAKGIDFFSEVVRRNVTEFRRKCIRAAIDQHAEALLLGHRSAASRLVTQSSEEDDSDEPYWTYFAQDEFFADGLGEDRDGSEHFVTASMEDTNCSMDDTTGSMEDTSWSMEDVPCGQGRSMGMEDSSSDCNLNSTARRPWSITDRSCRMTDRPCSVGGSLLPDMGSPAAPVFKPREQTPVSCPATFHGSPFNDRNEDRERFLFRVGRVAAHMTYDKDYCEGWNAPRNFEIPRVTLLDSLSHSSSTYNRAAALSAQTLYRHIINNTIKSPLQVLTPSQGLSSQTTFYSLKGLSMGVLASMSVENGYQKDEKVRELVDQTFGKNNPPQFGRLYKIYLGWLTIDEKNQDFEYSFEKINGENYCVASDPLSSPSNRNFGLGLVTDFTNGGGILIISPSESFEPIVIEHGFIDRICCCVDWNLNRTDGSQDPKRLRVPSKPDLARRSKRVMYLTTTTTSTPEV